MLKLVNNQNILHFSNAKLFNLVQNNAVFTDFDIDSFEYKPEFILTPLFNHLEPFYCKSLKVTKEGLYCNYLNDIFINQYVAAFLSASNDYLKNKNQNEGFIEFLFRKCQDKEYIDFYNKYTSEGNAAFVLNLQLFNYEFKIFS